MDIEGVKRALGEFAQDFTIAVEGNYVVARAIQFIPDKEAWAEIARRMYGVGAEWMSGLGKQSHWRVPVSHAVEGSQQNILDKLDRTIDVLQVCLRDLNEVKKALKEK